MSRRGLSLHRCLRSSALVLACLAACAQLSGIAHLLLVPHAVCAQHGAIEHVTHVAHVAHVAKADLRGAGSAVSRSAASQPYAALDALPGDDHDEHCASYLARREQALIAAATSQWLTAAFRPTLAAPALAAHPAVVSVFAYAPKSSPPALRA